MNDESLQQYNFKKLVNLKKSTKANVCQMFVTFFQSTKSTTSVNYLLTVKNFFNLPLILVEFAFQIDPSAVKFHSYIVQNQILSKFPEKRDNLTHATYFSKLISIHQSVYASITTKKNKEVCNYINFLPIKFKERGTKYNFEKKNW